MDDSERDRLAVLLAAPPYRDSALRLDALHGLCTAMAMGPDDEPPAQWMEVALGAGPGQTPDAELASLLEQFRASTAAAVAAGTPRIDALATRTGRVDYTGWCRGFLDGVAMSTTDWFDVAEPEDLDELMFPIDVLGGALTEQERASYKPAQWRTLLRDCEAALQESVARLGSYWSIVRAPTATFRREEPKVGRNDACPCGSGRKFKHCHGTQR